MIFQNTKNTVCLMNLIGKHALFRVLTKQNKRVKSLKKIEFTLPIKVNSKLSLNSIYGGLHWGLRRKQSQEIHEIVRLSMQAQNVSQEIFKNPVNIIFKWNSKLDLDNHGYIAKLIVDGLKGVLIYDDRKKYIKSITHNYWQGNGIKVEIEEIKENKK